MPNQNNELARAYLHEICKGWDALPEKAMIELRCLFPDRTPFIARYDFDAMGIGFLIDDAANCNARGVNAYVVVNPVRADAPMRRNGHTSGAMDEDIIASFFCWADGDTEDAGRNILNFVGPRYTMAVTTGTVPFQRPHIYWRLEEPCFDLKAWTEIQRSIAATLSTDRTVVNPSRIMRLPGMVNWPTDKKAAKGYIAEVSTFRAPGDYQDPRAPVAIDAMARAFRQSPEANSASTPFQLRSASFQIETGTDRPALDRDARVASILAGDHWHANMIAVVASYIARGLSDAEIHAITDNWTLAGYTVEQTRREVQTAIDGGRRKGWTPQAQYASPEAIRPPAPPPDAGPAFDAPPRAVPALEWFDDIQPAMGGAYIVKHVLDQGAMSVVYGPSNSGKTFWATDLAFHIAAAMPWRGYRVAQAAVLYVAAEGGRGVSNRIAAIRAELAFGQVDIPFALRRGGMDLLHEQADLQAVCDMAAEVQAKAPGLPLMIVIDTLSRIMAGGDENNAADMTALIRNVDAIREKTAAHIMLIHHTGKDVARGARGHSSLRAATDTEIEVSNEGGARAAMVTKQRDNPGGETFAFSLKVVELGTDQDGDPVTSCVVEMVGDEEHSAKAKRTKGLGGNQKIIADAFDQMLGEGLAKPNPGGVGMPEIGKFWTVDYAELRRISMGKMVATDTRSSFNKAMQALTQDRGLFCTGENLVWRIDRKVNK